MPTPKSNITNPAWTVDERRYLVRDHGSLPGYKILFIEEGRVAHAVAQERVVFELFRGAEELWRLLRQATTDRPWPPEGPPVEEGVEFLGYFEGDNWREISREADGAFCFADGRKIRTPPTHYRHLPSPPRSAA